MQSTNRKKIIIVSIALVIIIAIVYAMYSVSNSSTSTSTTGINNNVINTNGGNYTLTDPTELSETYYNNMMDLIMKTNGMYAPGFVYSEYPVKGFVEELNPLFYSGDYYEFDNVVNKRMSLIIDMKNPAYLINGDVTKPGALIDAYAEVDGEMYLSELTEMFNDYKAQYLTLV